MSVFVDFHIVQDVPPSCINRDDNGSPKSAIYGGVPRLRVSSQAWKRATRKTFEAGIDRSERGVRTSHIVEFVENAIVGLNGELADRAEAMAEEVIAATGIKIKPQKKGKEGDRKVSGYLLFLSEVQIQLLAEEAVAAMRAERPVDVKTAKKVISAENSIDLALFGRMVADEAAHNVDAACQVAHALSTHSVETEFDFFTAVDEGKERTDESDAGAGMMGTVEFSSATLYRYATINLDQLTKNLGTTEAAIRAVTAFANAFITSMPTGKVNTFANYTVPSLVVATVRDNQPVSYVGAFEQPIQASREKGYTSASISKLVEFASDIEKIYGMKPVKSFAAVLDSTGVAVEPLGTRVTIPELTESLASVLESQYPMP